tara:strand:- start:843 stop:1532 length:690 start_codon:yes stop_codon:yes gene_type:complete
LLDAALSFHRFDEQYCDLDFSEFSAACPREMVTNLSFALSFTGLMLQPNNVANIRIEDGLKVFTKGSRMVEYDTEPLLFDTQRLKECEVYDHFWWRAGSRHDTNLLTSRDRLCRRVMFYSSERNHVQNAVKDVVISSKMNNDDLYHPNCGIGMVRIKALRMMKHEGIKGKFAHERNGNRYYKRIKIEFQRRSILPKFKQLHSFRQVYNMEQVREKPWKMFEKLRQKQKI